MFVIDTQLYIRRKSQIGCKFRERAKWAVNSEKEPNWLSIGERIELPVNLVKRQSF